MPGWYIHMSVAGKAIDGLPANAGAAALFASGGPNAATLKAIAQSNPAYVALGAIGPDIFFLLPDFKPPVGSMIFKLASEIRELYTWWDDNFLGPYESAMGPIGNNAADELNALTGGLKERIEGIFGQAFSFLKDSILRFILQQYDFFGLLSSGVPAGFDEQTFFWSDMLHYRQTYHFAAALWKRANNPAVVADETDRARLKAFALGWMSHLATDVTGHAFVNQKAGGPYRLHWQRHHLVENHMDAQVYGADHGSQAIYDQMANSALHLWLAFNPDGSSRVDLFAPEPNPAYPPGDHSADITGRHAVWDVDSDLPDGLAKFVSDTLKDVYNNEGGPSAISSDPTGMISCCPTIISSLDGRVPLETSGYAEPGDISGAYWWLYHYLKWVTTDYYKIRRPTPPEVFVIPSFPSPPGSGDSDPGPGASEDHGTWPDLLDLLLSLLAWGAYLAEIAVWPASLIAGIVAGAGTYPLRYAIYQYMELPLYNLWLAVHTYLAMTGYVMPMTGEINAGLNTLGVSVNDAWSATVVALGDPDGGLISGILSADPSGLPRDYPRDVLVDPASFLGAIASGLGIGPPIVGGELPSEFTRPWRYPQRDNEGDNVNVELPASTPGPFTAGVNATGLFGASPGTKAARDRFENAKSEADTLRAAMDLLPRGQHLGDPQDYSAYVIAQLTRDGVDPKTVANFNLDADRGYGYLCWDWLRLKDWRSQPSGFRKQTDPGHGNTLTDVSMHVYPTPAKPGYGWDPADQNMTAAHPAVPGFDPNIPESSVSIRYIGKEQKYKP